MALALARAALTAPAPLLLNAALCGARLILDGALGGSRLRDPVTGADSPLDDIAPRSLTAEFRHDNAR